MSRIGTGSPPAPADGMVRAAPRTFGSTHPIVVEGIRCWARVGPGFSRYRQADSVCHLQIARCPGTWT